MMSVRVYGVIVLVMLLGFDALGQKRSNDVIQLGLLSTGSILSVDYEHFYFDDGGERGINLSSGIGMGYNEEVCFLWCGYTDSYISVPHHVALNINTSKQGILQIGMAGASISVIGAPPVYYRGYPMLAYRHLPVSRNKLAFQIRVSYPSNEGWEGWATSPVGLYFGWTL